MNYKFFLCNKDEIRKHVKINLIRALYSPILYIKISRKYKSSNDFASIRDDLMNLRNIQQTNLDRNRKKYTTHELIFTALSWTHICRLIGYIFRQSDLCLNRSYALAYVLIYLGIPCFVIVGKAQYYLNRNYQFHAWVELSEMPVNDSLGVKQQWKKVLVL
mgnify:CR=1 FL=1